MKTFPDIWEKEAKWLSGPQILTEVVESLRGKSLRAERDGDRLAIRLPLNEVLDKDGTATYELFFMIPEQLRDIMEEQLQGVMDSFRRAIMTLVAPYEGQPMFPSLIAQINGLLANREEEFRDARYPTLADHVALAFGLPHLCHSIPIEIGSERHRKMKEERYRALTHPSRFGYSRHPRC